MIRTSQWLWYVGLFVCPSEVNRLAIDTFCHLVIEEQKKSQTVHMFSLQSCLDLATGVKYVNQLDMFVKQLMTSQARSLAKRRKSSFSMVSLPRLGSCK